MRHTCAAAPLVRRPSQRQEMGITLGSVLDQPMGLAHLRLDEWSIMDGGLVIDTEYEVVNELCVRKAHRLGSNV